MARPKIADAGWAEHTIGYLEQALKSAKDMASDLSKMRLCDHSGCGRIFDCTDPRSTTAVDAGIEYHFCPGCELENRRR